MKPENPKKNKQVEMPAAERVAQELAKAQSMDDFFGWEGIFAQLFAQTMEQMLEAELTDELGYEPYEAKGRNSGNSRNGHYRKKVRTSAGETELKIPRDRQGEFEPEIVKKYEANTNELERKIIALYAKGLSNRDIAAMLAEIYGVSLSASRISTVTDKVWPLVEEWQGRTLEAIYPIVYLDAIHLKIRRDHQIENTAVYIVLGVQLDGQRDVLGHWIGQGSEGANFWLTVLSDLEQRGVEDIFIAAVDGLSGFEEAIAAVFPHTLLQRCIIHQIRHSLRYVPWKHRRAFAADLKRVYQAPTRETAQRELAALGQKWAHDYPIAVRSWENNWDALSTFFDFPAEIRRLIYTTNTVEGYQRQLRKVLKTKGTLPSSKAARKLLYLVHENIQRKWTRPLAKWPKILNQLAIRFEGRFPI